MSENFLEERSAFVERVALYAMDKECAYYCISVAKRLRNIYAGSERTQELEEEALRALRNVLYRLPQLRSIPADTVTTWECIPGGLHEGDETALYVVPPGRDPIPVPMQPLTVPELQQRGLPVTAEALHEWQQASAAAGERIRAQQAMIEAQQARAQYQNEALRQMFNATQQGYDSELVKNIEARIEHAADRAGWGRRLRESDIYREFKRQMVALELSKMRGAAAPVREAMVKQLFHAVRDEHEREQAEAEARVRGDSTITYPLEHKEYGFKQLQEINEKRKRQARSRR